MPTKEDVKAFYDGFLPQLATVNNRHKKIFQSLDSLPKGKALDIGCGAGLTSLRLAQGDRYVVAVDFSPLAICHAKRHNGHENIRYVCADISEFQTDEKFDVICLVDVLEHLEKAVAKEALSLINDVSHDGTVVYLNIPYGETLRYLASNHPGILQPIDEPYDIGEIVGYFEDMGFIPFRMEMYWMQYVEYSFCTKTAFREIIAKTYQSLRSNGNG